MDTEEGRKLIDIIKNCLEKMDKKFTDLSKLEYDEVSGNLKEIIEKQKIQERPFAYEFYHQFRKLWECGGISAIIPKGIIVQAEVNKTYQHIPNLEKIPDFLLHKPSTNENFAVLEFKRVNKDNISKIEDDFKKLVYFNKILGYKYLIEVVIGNTKQLKSFREEWINNLDERGTEIVVVEFNIDEWKADDFKIKYSITN